MSVNSQSNSGADPGLTGMCTTMTAAVIYGNGLIIGHTGDSIYQPDGPGRPIINYSD